MNDKRHKQFRVLTFKPDGTPEKMELTNLGHVMITDRDREINNQYVRSTRLWYVLDEKPEKVKIDVLDEIIHEKKTLDEQKSKRKPKKTE